MKSTQMTAKDFRNLTAEEAAKHPPLLHALWHEAHENWQQAHEFAQNVNTPEGSWVHAYLHRKEGDQWNAEYWYRRAGKPVCTSSLEEEWTAIVSDLLSANTQR